MKHFAITLYYKEFGESETFFRNGESKQDVLTSFASETENSDHIRESINRCEKIHIREYKQCQRIL